MIVGAPGADDDHWGGGAAYIFRIRDDGTRELEARLTGPDGKDQGDRAFGGAVAIDGNLALVGAPLRYPEHGLGFGVVHLYSRNDPDNVWVEECRIEGARPGSRVGLAVDISDGLAVIGDPDRVVSRPGFPPIEAAGSVLFVEYHGLEPEPCRLSWVEPPEPRIALDFGAAVSVDGELMAVGAPGAEKYRPSNGGTFIPESGEVSIFRLENGEWTHENTVDGLVGTEQRNGAIVKIDGDLLITAAPGYQKVFLFDRNQDGVGSWGMLEEFWGEEWCPGSDFGSSISLHQDLIAIGIPRFDPSGSGQRVNAGGVMVFRQSPSSRHVWINEGRYSSPGSNSGDRFGQTVSVYGNLLIVGAPFFDTPDVDSGLLCLHSPSGVASPRWQRDGCITSVAKPTARGGRLGSSVDVRSTTMAIGQPGESTVHVFERTEYPTPGWTPVASLRLEEESGVQAIGVEEVVAVGEDEIVVGVPYGGNDEFAGGAVYVASDQGEGWQITQVIAPPVSQPFLRFGIDVDIDEEVLAVAAQGAGDSDSLFAPGSVFVIEPASGSGSPWANAVELSAPGDIGALSSPTAIAVDGYTVVACDHTWGWQAEYRGACDVFRRSEFSGEWEFHQRFGGSLAEPWMTFGYDVAIDANRILVGAPYWGSAFLGKRSTAFVYEKSSEGSWVKVAQFLQPEEAVVKHMGWSVDLDGDVAVIGAPAAGDPPLSGEAIVYRHMGIDQWDRVALLRSPSAENGQAFGWAVAIDGLEVVVGMPFDREQGFEAGAAMTFVRRLERNGGERRAPE